MNFTVKQALATTLLALFIGSTTCLAKIDPEGKVISFDKQHSRTALEIIKVLNTRHYSRQTLDDDLSSNILDNYLDRLDGNRQFFLQSDIEEFERYRYRLDNTLLRGNLTPAAEIFNRYQQRLKHRLNALIEELPAMVENMDFERDESLIIDRQEQPWPKDEKAAGELWRKIIKSRVLSLRMADKEPKAIVELLQKRYKNQLNRVKQSNSEDTFQIYMNAFTSLYDPHSNYLSPISSENFDINMSLSLQGIGAVLQTEDEFTKVVRLVHAGPADKQGQLQPSDRIVGVAEGTKGDFVDVVGMRLDEVVQLIRGPKDSQVRLQVIPVSAKTDDEMAVISIIRDTVKLEEQSAQKKILEVFHEDRLQKIGIIEIPTFYLDFDALHRGDRNFRSTTRDVQKLLKELLDEEVDGIIVDLRNNGGGSLREANLLTGLFIERGPIVQIRHSNSRTDRQGKPHSSAYYTGPLAVLINRLSASASEIFAGAIQDYGRGIIVGSQSFGKGSVQSLTPLQHGRIKITESKFYRISGESTQHRGIIPDIAFPTLFDREKVGESALDFALKWDQIEPMRYRQYYNLQAMLPELIRKHQQRIKDDPDFIYLQDQLSLMEEARQINSISLNEKQRTAQQADDKAKALAIENKRRKAKGLEPLAKLEEKDLDEEGQKGDEADDALTDEKDEEEIDPLLTETGHILLDSIPAYRPKRVASGH